MAKGLKVLQAITERRRGWPPNAEFPIRALDALALLTLSKKDLLAERFKESVAEQVLAALKSGDILPLGQRLGVRFVYNDEAAPLLAEPKPRTKRKKPKPAAKSKKSSRKKK
jgi:hypothetical protein